MRKIIILVASVIVLIACTTEKTCDQINQNSGLIKSNLVLGKCYSLLNKSFYVINDSNSYNYLFNEVDTTLASKLGCSDSIKLPVVNFDSLTVLALKTEVTGCMASYYRNVYFDSVQNKYIYRIDVEVCGDCLVDRVSMNYVVIDKIKDSTKILSEVQYHK